MAQFSMMGHARRALERLTRRRRSAGDFHASHLLPDRRRARHRATALELLEPRSLLDAAPLISELMAVNDDTLLDEDQEASDWLELHNPGAQSLALTGWHLTDDPNDLTKWQFPVTTLPAGGFLVVFASEKDRATAGSQLHTNFRLSGDGEYLALVMPDGNTRAHAYAPSFPRQIADLSFGVTQQVDGLIGADADARTFVPVDGGLGTQWTTPAFDDSTWSAGTTGVGFEIGLGSTAIAYGNLDGAVGSQEYGGSLGMDFVVNTPITVSQLGVFDSGADGLARTLSAELWTRAGNSGTRIASLTFTPSNPGMLVDSDRFKSLAEPLLLDPGDYTIVAHGYGAGEPNGNVSGPDDTFKTLDDGEGIISFVGGARYGTAGQFPSTPDSGPVNRYSAGTFQFQVPAFQGLIGTDVANEMRGVNASAYTRVEFTVDDPERFASLSLGMRYDDGFVAYLNGIEVARDNAPAAPQWNSAATAARAVQDAIQTAQFNITEHLSALAPGGNVLAIHGLNVDAADDTFLMLPELVAAASPTDVEPAYFDQPTPGGPNDSQSSFAGFVDPVTISHEHGFYDAPFDVTLSSATPGAETYYTTDGSVPTSRNGAVYAGPIAIATTTTLRAAAFQAGLRPAKTETATYLFLDDVVDRTTVGPEYPASWNGVPADYGMSQNVSDLPLIAGDASLSVDQAKDAVKNSLLALPTMSIVLPSEALFNSSSGIYVNPTGRGINWERAASVEYILPDGSQGFSVDAGLRIMGFTSRNLQQSPKLSMRLLFKKIYGPGRLEYPFFDDTTIDSFNTLTLRANVRDGWLNNSEGTGSRATATFIKDQWARAAQRDMGQLASSGNFVHLYINGIYWGMYNAAERPDAAFAAEHSGGNDEDYDAVKFCCPDRAVDGTIAMWDRLLTLAQAGLGSDAAYQFVQGNNPDGTRNPNFDVLLDVDNLIDFIIDGQYHASVDWPGNYYVIRERGPQSTGFKFFQWDNDIAFPFADINRDKTTSDNNSWWTESPGVLDLALRANAEYRLRFADHVHRHLFNDGALTPSATSQRWRNIADSVAGPLIAESARWGDYRRDVSPAGSRELYTPSNQWQQINDRLLNDYFPFRTDVVVKQQRGRGLYPDIEAPEFNQHGGQVNEGFGLTIAARAGTIYYTLDGTDPRLPGGGVNPDALSVDEAVATALIASLDPATVLIPTDDSLGVRWTETDFDDALWTAGATGIGYERNVGYADLIATDVEAEMFDVNTTAYIRVPFQATDVAGVQSLQLKMKYDDGFVAYLNGVEVARRNAPDALRWDSEAMLPHPDSQAVMFETIDISPYIFALQSGDNVLAFHGLNSGANSSDFLILPELEALTFADHRIPLTQSGLVMSRALSRGQWSALNEASFFVNTPADASNLVVTELNYNPHAPTAAELAMNPTWTDSDFEFVEFHNTSDDTIDLTHVAFTDGIEFTFSGGSATSLATGEYVLVVRNVPAFEARYGAGHNIAGVFASGGLSNGGETIAVTDRLGELIAQFTYNDAGAWPGRADGNGSSLEIVDVEGDYNDPQNWRASAEYGGSPGTAGLGAFSDIVVNEVLTRSDVGAVDLIELHNPTAQDVNIGGWFLSDTNNNYFKFTVAPNTTIPAGGYRVFDESHFNPTPGMGTSFALDGAHGDDVWLLAADAVTGLPVRFADRVEFGATEIGVSLGRWPNAAGDLFPMTLFTPGQANSGPRFGPVIISEVMYNPTEMSGDEDLEFVEVYNTAAGALNVGDWRLDGAVEIQFPAGTMLPAGGTLVLVHFDPADAVKAAAFRTHYGVDESVRLHGPYNGMLDNGGERLQLLRPDSPPPSEPEFTPHVQIDEVNYDDMGGWASTPDGQGDSLTRAATNLFGNFAASWAGEAPTPGSTNFAPSQPGDADGDGDVDVDDLNAVRNNFGGNGFGDANGDGVVNIDDLNAVRNNFGAAAAAPALATFGDEVDSSRSLRTTAVSAWRNMHDPLSVIRSSRGHLIRARAARLSWLTAHEAWSKDLLFAELGVMEQFGGRMDD